MQQSSFIPSSPLFLHQNDIRLRGQSKERRKGVRQRRMEEPSRGATRGQNGKYFVSRTRAEGKPTEWGGKDVYAADTRTAQPASKEWHTTSGGVKGMKSTTEWRLYVLRNFRPSKWICVEPDGRKHNTYVDDRISSAYIRYSRSIFGFWKILIFFFWYEFLCVIYFYFARWRSNPKLYEFNFWKIYHFLWCTF